MTEEITFRMDAEFIKQLDEIVAAMSDYGATRDGILTSAFLQYRDNKRNYISLPEFYHHLGWCPKSSKHYKQKYKEFYADAVQKDFDDKLQQAGVVLRIEHVLDLSREDYTEYVVVKK